MMSPPWPAPLRRDRCRRRFAWTAWPGRLCARCARRRRRCSLQHIQQGIVPAGIEDHDAKRACALHVGDDVVELGEATQARGALQVGIDGHEVVHALMLHAVAGIVEDARRPLPRRRSRTPRWPSPSPRDRRRGRPWSRIPGVSGPPPRPRHRCADWPAPARRDSPELPITSATRFSAVAGVIAAQSAMVAASSGARQHHAMTGCMSDPPVIQPSRPLAATDARRQKPHLPHTK